MAIASAICSGVAFPARCAALQPATTGSARDATPQAAFHLHFSGEFGGCDQPRLELGALGSRQVACDITRDQPGLLFERLAIKRLHE